MSADAIRTTIVNTQSSPGIFHITMQDGNRWSLINSPLNSNLQRFIYRPESQRYEGFFQPGHQVKITHGPEGYSIQDLQAADEDLAIGSRIAAFGIDVANNYYTVHQPITIAVRAIGIFQFIPNPHPTCTIQSCVRTETSLHIHLQLNGYDNKCVLDGHTFASLREELPLARGVNEDSMAVLFGLNHELSIRRFDNKTLTVVDNSFRHKGIKAPEVTFRLVERKSILDETCCYAVVGIAIKTLIDFVRS